MKKLAKFTLVILIITIMSVLFASCNTTDNKDVTYNQNVLTNGDFELGIDSWTTSNTSSNSSATVMGSAKETNSDDDNFSTQNGRYVYEIEIVFQNGSYEIKQDINLVSGVTYKLSVDINVPSALKSTTNTDYNGAIVRFDGDGVGSRIEQTSTTNGFVNHTIYITPKSTATYTLILGLGTKDYPVLGLAQFDNVSVTPITNDTIPDGQVIYNISQSGAIANDMGYNITKDGHIYVITLSILTALFVVCAYIIFKLYNEKDNDYIGLKLRNKNVKAYNFFTNSYFWITLTVLVGFAIRIIVASLIIGYSNDLNILSNLSSYLVNKDFSDIYTKYSSNVMPGGTLYLLWAIGYIAKILGISFGSTGFFILLKIPSILSEIIIIYLIFELAKKYYNIVTATTFSMLYAVLPIFFTISAAWGQFFMLPVLMIVLSMLAFVDKKCIKCIIYYAIAVFIEPAVVVLLPILIGLLTIQFINNPDKRVGILITFVSSFVALYLINLPFTYKLIGEGKVFYFLTADYSYLVNTFFTLDNMNFFGMIAKNAVNVNVASRVINIIITLAIAAWMIYVYYANRNRLEILLISSFALAMYSVFGLYTRPFFITMSLVLLLLYTIMTNETRLYWIFAIFAFTSFVNVAQALNISGYIGSGINAAIRHFIANDALCIIFGIINTLTAIYYAFVVFDIFHSANIKEMTPFTEKFKSHFRKKIKSSNK